jgi:hypothetical protein
VPKLDELAKPVATKRTKVEPPPDDAAAPVAPSRPSAFTARRKVAVAVGVVAVGAGVTAVVLGTIAHNKQHDAFALCPDPATACAQAAAANADLTLARSRALDANIGFAAAGALALGAVVLWATGSPPARRERVTIVPTGTGAAIAGSF